MAGIAVPRQQLVQPQGRLQVARRWANNLRGAFLLRDRTVFDPVSGLMLSGTGAQGVHPFGTAYDITATSHYIDTGVTDLGGVTLHAEDGVPFSVTVKFRTTTTGTVLARAGATVTARTFQLFSNGTSQSPVVVVRGTQTVYNWGYQDGAWHTVTVAWDGETVRVYGDGDREASFSRGNAVEETTQRILIGARSNGANFALSGSSVEFAYVFDRALTRDEHLALVDNPYQVFRTERRLYAVEATGGGPATTVLTGRSMSAAPTVSRGAISQTRVLTGRSLAGAPTLSRGAVTQGSVTALTGRSLSAAPTVTRGAISQTRVLTGRSLANAPTVSRGAIEQGAVPELAGRDLTAAPAITRGAIRQTHILAGRDLIALPTIYVPGQAGSPGALVATPQDRSLRLAVEPVWFTHEAALAALHGTVTSAPLRAEVR